MAKYLLLLVLSGCAAQLTDEEREYRLQETYDKWLVCQEVYRRSGAVWHSTFRHPRRGVPQYLDMSMDLGRNSCHYVLRQIGYE